MVYRSAIYLFYESIAHSQYELYTTICTRHFTEVEEEKKRRKIFLVNIMYPAKVG